ncbi:two pore domain potassium channel family protein [Epibacterium sp. SM1979]|uniref:Two pore domain potassium channel family protein n=1 Tax=Tritonibacter litoralis TaxID=2662264 RepID=A0A843YHR4_9RHOB|nr:ion channel [Tritonibacter litoralis]MQQ09358.1 two pore domain potassium channel family protein [Tritonibacter litoralis]
MIFLGQIFYGSTLLVACALLHVVILAGSIQIIVSLTQKLEHAHHLLRENVILAVGVMLMVLAHAFEIWLWALSFMWTGAVQEFETSFYFSLVTYTTLGYGDITLEQGHRIYGTFASITGLLCFGISTAFLLGIIVRLFPNIQQDPR